MEYLKGRTVIVACGVGRDSTAMLIGLQRRGIRPDAVLFANVGSEKAETYAYIPILNGWLKRVGFPELTVVQYKPVRAGVPYTTIEGNCTCNATLPGAAFNLGSCTTKWKIEPQNRWTKKWAPAQAAWSRGERIVKLIGFECTETKRVNRAAHAGSGTDDKDLYEYHYPLCEWGWDLQRCIDTIASEGLKIPCKSACFFCPNSKPTEIDTLSAEYRTGIMLLELAAEPYNEDVWGLWRKPVKKSGRPGSITEYILANRLPYMPFGEYLRKHPEIAVLNPNCAKFKTGYTFRPPFNQNPLWSKVLRDRLEREAGMRQFVVPTCGGCSDAEDIAHGQIVEGL